MVWPLVHKPTYKYIYIKHLRLTNIKPYLFILTRKSLRNLSTRYDMKQEFQVCNHIDTIRKKSQGGPHIHNIFLHGRLALVPFYLGWAQQVFFFHFLLSHVMGSFTPYLSFHSSHNPPTFSTFRSLSIHRDYYPSLFSNMVFQPSSVHFHTKIYEFLSILL